MFSIISNLKIKFSTFKFMLKNNPMFKLLIIIDIIFYLYLFFGFYISTKIGIHYNFTVMTTSIFWTVIFIPILISKIYKEINKEKFIKDNQYDK